jgi:hypothetical protein
VTWVLAAAFFTAGITVGIGIAGLIHDRVWRSTE